MKFEIGALPRSGSAWIAAVLNYAPDVVCVHEPIDRNVPEPKGRYASTGESGSHLLLGTGEGVDLRICIARPPSESRKSMEAVDVFVGDADFDVMEDKFYDYAKNCHECVPFSELFTPKGVEKIWGLVTDAPFEYDKVVPMFNMNVQRQSLEYDFDDRFLCRVAETIKKGGR